MIGAMRNEITLQEPTNATAADGQVTRTYTDNSIVMAECQVMGGGEVMRGEQIVATVPTVFRIRYPHQEPRPGPLWRISWDSRTFEVETVQDRDGRMRFMHLIATEVL